MSAFTMTEPFEAPTVPPIVLRRPPIRPRTTGVLIPAHNEAEQIANTIYSLRHQTLPPDIILVISDNSTDKTAQVAHDAGARVVRTEGNKFKKAGALNAGVRALLQGEYFPEVVVSIDGDTDLERNCLERGVTVMRHDRTLGGLSVVCFGKKDLVHWPSWHNELARAVLKRTYRKGSAPTHGQMWRWRGIGILAWVWLFVRACCSAALMWAQRAEYARASFVRLRRNVHTLSGAGSFLRGLAIYETLDERERDGKLYVERVGNLVEDFEVTLALKARWRCTNNCYLIAYTDLMPNLRMLLRQRLRWVGGTINELRRQGWKPQTRISIVTMMYGYFGIPVYYVWIGLVVRGVMIGAAPMDFWFTICVGAYQALGVHKLGWRSMILGFVLIPECLYMLLRHCWLLLSLVYAYCGLLRKW